MVRRCLNMLHIQSFQKIVPGQPCSNTFKILMSLVGILKLWSLNIFKILKDAQYIQYIESAAKFQYIQYIESAAIFQYIQYIEAVITRHIQNIERLSIYSIYWKCCNISMYSIYWKCCNTSIFWEQLVGRWADAYLRLWGGGGALSISWGLNKYIETMAGVQYTANSAMLDLFQYLFNILNILSNFEYIYIYIYIYIPVYWTDCSFHTCGVWQSGLAPFFNTACTPTQPPNRNAYRVGMCCFHSNLPTSQKHPIINQLLVEFGRCKQCAECSSKFSCRHACMHVPTSWRFGTLIYVCSSIYASVNFAHIQASKHALHGPRPSRAQAWEDILYIYIYIYIYSAYITTHIHIHKLFLSAGAPLRGNPYSGSWLCGRVRSFCLRLSPCCPRMSLLWLGASACVL